MRAPGSGRPTARALLARCRRRRAARRDAGLARVDRARGAVELRVCGATEEREHADRHDGDECDDQRVLDETLTVIAPEDGHEVLEHGISFGTIVLRRPASSARA